jgi:hypothetical protein
LGGSRRSLVFVIVNKALPVGKFLSVRLTIVNTVAIISSVYVSRGLPISKISSILRNAESGRNVWMEVVIL